MKHLQSITFRKMGMGQVGRFLFLLAALSGMYLSLVRDVVPAWAATPIYVRNAGNNDDCDGTADVDYSAGVAPACAFQTITYAISQVDLGGTVSVAAGTYAENVTVNRAITLSGGTDPAGATPARLQGTITITSPNVTVSQLRVEPGNVVGNAGGIEAHAGNVVVVNNIISGMTGNGTGTVKGIHIYDGSLPASTNIRIEANRIENISNPVGFGGANGVSVQGVVVNVSLIGNTIDNITSAGWAYGVDVSPTNIVGLAPPQNVTIEQNSISLINPSGTTLPPFAGIGVIVDNAASVNGDAGQVTVFGNSFATVPSPLYNNAASGRLNGSGNWLGSNVAATFVPYILGDVDFTPWLDSGTDTSTKPGFQGDFASLHVDARGAQVGTTGRIQEGINLVTTGGIVQVEAGSYAERAIVNKSLTLRGVGAGTDPALNTILDGSTLGTGTSGIQLPAGTTHVTIQDLTVRNYTLTNSNSAGISGAGSNNHFIAQRVQVLNNLSGRGGLYLNGPVDTVLFDQVTAHDNQGRGIVIWNGHKTNITITNNDVRRNNCCGIELQDGTASGVTMSNNTVVNNTDSGMSAIGLMAGSGPNVIANNTVTDNGRFGIEIKLPNGTGLDSGDGSIVIQNNIVARTLIPTDARDLAGIAVFRRGWLTGNVDIPTGVIVRNNTVSGYRQTTTSDGFGIVVEGNNMTVSGNTLNNNDVGVQLQAGHLPYTPNTNIDGDQANLADQYFGRGNSPVGCAAILNNTFSGNTVDTRNVGAVGGGTVINSNTSEAFCSIQSAIDDAGTLDGHSINIGIGTYRELIDISKSITLVGVPGVVIQPSENIPDFTSNHSGSIIWVQANDVTISNLEIDGDNPNISGGYPYGGADINAVRGIYMNGTFYNNTDIDNLTVRNLGRGVNLYGGQSHTITNNTVTNLGGPTDNSNYGYGVLLMGNTSATITGNTVSDAMTAGIFMQNNYSNNTTSTQIANNTVTNSGMGLGWNMLYGGTTGTVENNTVSGVELGMQVTSITNGSLEIRNNDFNIPTGNDEWGFYVWNTAPNMVLITGNELSGGDIGVALFDDSADFGNAQAHLTLTNNIFEGTGTVVTVTSNSASHNVSLRATDNTITNATTGFNFNGTEDINNITLAGNSLDTLDTVFDISTNSTLTAYANNITNFTDAGLTSAAGTFNARHNWWGTHATQPAGVDNDSWAYRLGADIHTWVDGSTSVALADAIAEADATLSGAGTLVIVNHGSGLANAPFGKGIAGDTGLNQCADFYDFFAIGGSGSYDISLPVDSACTGVLIGDNLFQFALDGAGAPDLTCSPDTACWNRITATRAGDVLTVVLPSSDLLGTPFAAPSRNNNDPTAIQLLSLQVGSGQASKPWLLPLGTLLLLGAGLVTWAVRRRAA